MNHALDVHIVNVAYEEHLTSVIEFITVITGSNVHTFNLQIFQTISYTLKQMQIRESKIERLRIRSQGSARWIYLESSAKG